MCWVRKAQKSWRNVLRASCSVCDQHLLNVLFPCVWSWPWCWLWCHQYNKPILYHVQYIFIGLFSITHCWPPYLMPHDFIVSSGRGRGGISVCHCSQFCSPGERAVGICLQRPNRYVKFCCRWTRSLRMRWPCALRSHNLSLPFCLALIGFPSPINSLQKNNLFWCFCDASYVA